MCMWGGMTSTYPYMAMILEECKVHIPVNKIDVSLPDYHCIHSLCASTVLIEHSMHLVTTHTIGWVLIVRF